MSRKLASAAAFCLAVSTPHAVSAFGGEDLLNGQPWHHADITLRARAGNEATGAPSAVPVPRCRVRFSSGAATSVAWHADYVDSYLYNPLWWAEGAPHSKRFKAAITIFDDLAKLHHDDTFSVDGLEDNWRRYSAGALLGLAYEARIAGRSDDDNDLNEIAAAHNILGLVAHATQDFYSHTNWVDDPQRQRMTWFSYRKAYYFDPLADFGAGAEMPSGGPFSTAGCTEIDLPVPDITVPVSGASGPADQPTSPDGTSPGYQPTEGGGTMGQGQILFGGGGADLTSPVETGVANTGRRIGPGGAVDLSNGSAVEQMGGVQQGQSGGFGASTVILQSGPGGAAVVRTMPTLYSGAYEEAEDAGQHAHGKYSASCSALRASGVASTLSGLCSGVSPLQGMPFCIMSRACDDSWGVDTSALGVPVESVLFQDPKGIALDTVQVSRIGARTRGLVDESGSDATSDDGRQTWDNAQCQSIINFGSVCDISGTRPNCSVCGVKTVDDVMAMDPLGLGRAVLGNCKVLLPQPACSKPADFAFADAKYLAILSTQEMFLHLGDAMARIDPASGDIYEKFWHRVANTSTPLEARTAQFEEFFRMPYQFLTAGPYPVGNAVAAGNQSAVKTSDGWYLRLRLKTSDYSDAGTSAHITATVYYDGRTAEQKRNEPRGVEERDLVGKNERLDKLPTDDAEANVSSEFLVYNDFEQGDNDVYTIGPFPSQPLRVSLHNDAADTEDVVGALIDDIGSSIDHFLTDLRRSLTSVYGANADFVGSAKAHESAKKVMDRDVSVPRTLVVEGGTEGRFRINYTERAAPEFLTDFQKAQGWTALEFTIYELHCDRESEADSLLSGLLSGDGDGDEPLLYVLGSSIGNTEPGGSVGQQFGPLADVHEGETHGLDQTKKIVVKFPRYGGYVLALQLWESDSEQGSDQYEMGQTFFTGVSEEVRRGNGQFLSALGRGLGEDWSLDHMEATPFYRGDRPILGNTTLISDIGWIDGETSRSFDLDHGALLLITGAGVGKWR
jgi:hypothetical protein